jgi:Xaa-Pro dipeptidase
MAILEHDVFMSDTLRRVPLTELQNRLLHFRQAMDEMDPAWQMAVITDKLDMYYFAGTMQDGALMIRPRDMILWVRRSLARARNESLLPETMLRRMHSFRQPAEYYGNEKPQAGVYLDKKHASLEWLAFFTRYFPLKEEKDLGPVLAGLRSVKSPYELDLMARAGRIHEQVLGEEAAPLFHDGISEAELAVQLYLKMLLRGSHGVARTNRPMGEDVIGLASFGKSALVRTAFDGPGGTGGTCVAVQSIGSAFRLLQPGRLVYLDIACGVDGYNTDKTVVYYYGDLEKDPEKKRILDAYAYCLELEKATAALLKPGAVFGAVYDTIMSGFRPEYEEYFMNGGRFLGHSIGLVMDETPVIAHGVREIVKENMTIAVEPKIGLPGIGMVGTENTYQITKEGARCLTGGPQKLMVVPARARV